MYRSIVRWRVNGLFNQVNCGNWQAVIDTLSENFIYTFVGNTPLGGTRTTKPAMQAWFQRIYRLVPDAKLRPQMIVVEGTPWNTRVMTYVKFRGTLPKVSNAPAKSYENEVMQLMRLKWGKIISVITIEDTQRFVDILPALSAAGINDATAPPITDENVKVCS
jgi:ketosteroid isomerase-like protein